MDFEKNILSAVKQCFWPVFYSFPRKKNVQSGILKKIYIKTQKKADTYKQSIIFDKIPQGTVKNAQKSSSRSFFPFVYACKKAPKSTGNITCKRGFELHGKAFSLTLFICYINNFFSPPPIFLN